MGVDIQTYRAKIGTFRHSCGIDVVTFVLVVNFSYGLKAVGSLLFIGVLLMMAGIEPNPGPTESGNTQSTKIKVTGIPKTADAEILTFFFENTKRKGGGTVKQVTVDNDRNSAIVEFEKAAAVDRVMKQQPIKILETEVNVEVYVDTITTRPTKIKVSGLPDSAKHEFLIMFFENERQGGGTVKSVTMYSDKHCAVIEFEEAEAVEFVLKNQPLLIRGKEVSLEAIIHETEDKLNSIKVSGLPEGAIGKACLQIYFENVDKGGGKVKEVYINKDECSAIIEFEEKNSVDIILKKLPIIILDTEVDVKRFSDSTFPCPTMPELQGLLSQDSIHTTETIQESVEDNFPKPEKARIPEPSYPDGGIDEPKRRSVRDMVSDFSKVIGERSPSDQKLSLNLMDRAIKKGGDSSETLILVSQDGDHATGAEPQESVETHFRRAKVLKPEKPPKPAKKPTKLEHTLEGPGNYHKYSDGEHIKSQVVTKLGIDIPSNSQQQKIKITNDGNRESDPNLSCCSEVSGLKCLGNRNDTTRTELTDCKSSPPVLKRVASDGSHPPIELEETKGKVFCKVLQKIGLENKYPGKICMRDVIAVDPNEFTEHEKKRISLIDIPWLLLKRLICAHSESRDITVSDEDGIEDNIDLDNTMSFISDVPVESQDISPLDVFTVVFQCCDPLLKQILFQKLYLCKIAVPFLFKHWTPNEFQSILSVWPLRTLAIENNVLSSSSKVKSKDVDVLELTTKILAFARFGRPRYSKSKLINSLLSDQGGKTFFNIDCPSGMTPRFLSNGQIEMFWLPTVGDKKDRFQEAMTFLNMRGDIKENFSVEILSFVANIVDAIVMIIDLDSILSKSNEVKDMLQNYSSVILIIADPLRQEVVKTIQRFQSDVAGSKQGISLRVICTHKGIVEQNVVDMVSSISKHINSQLMSNTTKPLQERLTSKGKIQTDEDDTSCQFGKKAAETLMKQMKEAGLPSRWKQILTPVHSTYSQQLGTLMKKRERERDFKKAENIGHQMKKIR
ncbi:uncharacterized protein LOC128551919, partial [Mercenaria mercenaria]|uniref:uncharacterized protein LOC128551919 n=1 Tax=Mercenaria mercenaria TaxID=6596 RepID=UPI00234F05BD